MSHRKGLTDPDRGRQSRSVFREHNRGLTAAKVVSLDGDYSTEEQLRAAIERGLPQLVTAIQMPGNEPILIHQDSFAADYTQEEYLLLGMVVKYAGIFRRPIHIVSSQSP